MNKSMVIRAVAAGFFILFLTVSPAMSQEQRRVRPAFPIAAGEKMLVIPGVAFNSNMYPTSTWTNYVDITRRIYHLELPVGTTLKRMVVEAKDDDYTDTSYLIFRLRRYPNGGGGSDIILRTTSTQGHSSPEFTQFITSPMNHTMLQGWTYIITLDYMGSVGTPKFALGVIKIIYEP